MPAQNNEGWSEVQDPSLLKNPTILRDDPIDGSTSDALRSDAFHHEAFADTIEDLLLRNVPPLSIGLFGAWGIGKSTIIRILSDRIRKSHSHLIIPVYFNAWKYSGDSFRRQFLIEAASQLFGRNDDRVTRLEHLNYSDVLKRKHQTDLVRSIRQAFHEFSANKIAVQSKGLTRLAMGVAILFPSVLLAAFITNYSSLASSAFLAAIMSGAFVWLAGIKFEDLFVIQSPAIYDPKLIFPEQFEQEFTALVTSPEVGTKKVAIIIDDLDRCDPKVVQDILVAMKNFTGQKNCFFIVPCDEEALVEAFDETTQGASYDDESLRKYFNVGIRIPPITSTDLVDFANRIARNTNVPSDVVQLAVLANCRDARKMKHFLNSFLVKYQIAKSRERAGLIPALVDANILELAKAVLIEDAYPKFFHKVVENPRIYQLIEEDASRPASVKAELESLGLEGWRKDFGGLEQLILRTQHIPMSRYNVFFSLKISNQESRIPRGSELKSAVIEGNVDLVARIAQEISSEDAQIATFDLLRDLLTRSNGAFLQNTITTSLALVLRYKVLQEAESIEVQRRIVSRIRLSPDMNIRSQPADLLLECASNVNHESLSMIADRYIGEFEDTFDIDNPQTLDNALKAIRRIYQMPNKRRALASAVNDQLQTRLVLPSVALNALDTLSLPAPDREEEEIPSHGVVLFLLSAIGNSPSTVGENVLRRRIVFRSRGNWYVGKLCEVLLQVMEASQPINSHREAVEFVLDSVIENAEIVRTEKAPHLWNAVQPVFDAFTIAEAKAKAIRAYMVFAGCAAEPNVKTQAQNSLLNILRSLSGPALRENLDFFSSLGAPREEEILKAVVEQELQLVRNEIQAPTERTKERIDLCFDYRQYLRTNAVEDLLIESLGANSDQAVRNWLRTIDECREKVSSEFRERVSIKALELASSNAYPDQRTVMYVNAMAMHLASCSPVQKNGLKQKFFDHLKGNNPKLRNAAAATIDLVRSSLADDMGFRIAAGIALRDIERGVTTPELPEYRAAIDAVVSQFDVLTDSEWTTIVELCKRMLSSGDHRIQESGMALSERAPKISGDAFVDLGHVLTTVVESGSNLADRAKNLLEKWQQLS